MSSGKSNAPAWRTAVAPYEHSDLWQSLWALANTLLPFLALWYLMLRSLTLSYWITLALALPAAGLYVRLFTIFHDCGHGSFFKARWANDLVGFLTGILTMVPYYQWRHDHNVHHATTGNLDKRGIGDIDTLTVEEYRALPRLRRLQYRLYRHPAILLLLGPLVKFGLIERFVTGTGGKKERYSVYITNAAVLAIVALVIWQVGLKAFLLVHLPIMWIGGASGIGLFYVQHQFEGTVWARQGKWQFADAALHGSSFLRLPRVLDWFTGSIGYHHIHHLSPRIPNYRLARCHKENPMFQLKAITFAQAAQSFSLGLWDEAQQRLVGFRKVV
ncbi:MAG: fatty acid desaturase [Mycobacterium leprae]